MLTILRRAMSAIGGIGLCCLCLVNLGIGQRRVFGIGQGCGEITGQVTDMLFWSNTLNQNVPYRVYLPPCYNESRRRYPYVLLLHGSGSDQTEWTNVLGVQTVLDQGINAQTLPPMILVMPNGGVSQDTNIFDATSWENIVIHELMPAAETALCTWGVREGRAIGGISRGGFWSFEIGFRHPDLFSAVGGHSPYFDYEIAPPEFNPLNLAESVQFLPGLQPRIWLDSGDNDISLANIQVLQQTLTNRDIPLTYAVNAGGDHSPAYWSAHLDAYLTFYGQTWPRSIEDLPSCQP